jgi:hypothetical protein
MVLVCPVTGRVEGGIHGLPAAVIRGSHLIPAYHYDRTDDLLGGASLALDFEDFDDDLEWRYYYVNM